MVSLSWTMFQPVSILLWLHIRGEIPRRLNVCCFLWGRYVAMEDFEEGLTCYRNAIRLDSRHYNAWYCSSFTFVYPSSLCSGWQQSLAGVAIDIFPLTWLKNQRQVWFGNHLFSTGEVWAGRVSLSTCTVYKFSLLCVALLSGHGIAFAEGTTYNSTSSL